jgi:hypothetical protein
MNSRDVVWYLGMATASAAGGWVAYQNADVFLAILAVLVAVQGAYIYLLEREAAVSGSESHG